jgi:GNAT superfamily N-acetyltransferase
MTDGADKVKSGIDALEGTEVQAVASLYRYIQPEEANRIGVHTESEGNLLLLMHGMSPIIQYNRAFGFAAPEDLLDDRLETIIGRFHNRRIKRYGIQIPVPLISEEVNRYLVSRGFARKTHWARLTYNVADFSSSLDESSVVDLTQEHAQGFASVVLSVFDHPKALAPLLIGAFGAAGWKHYGVFDRHELVGTAALFVSGEKGWLGFAATLPEYRGRGFQSALIARRIADAREAGCQQVSVETGEDRPEKPNQSFRNLQRLGFEFRYLRANYIFEDGSRQ